VRLGSFKEHLGLNREILQEESIYLYKLQGLIISDGDFAKYVKSPKKAISFRGLTAETARTIIATVINIAELIEVRLSRQNTLKYGKRYFTVKVLLKTVYSKKIRDYINDLMMNSRHFMDSLSMKEKAALLAGLLDGDGYVGREGGYVSISYSENTVKGKIIRQVLDFLDERGYIRKGKYRGKPHYEQVIKFNDQKFMYNVINMVFHERRRKRLAKYYVDRLRVYECKYSIKELKQLLEKASSAYIDYRISEGRNAAVLVLYIYTIRGGRRIRKPVKISSKCKENIARILKAGNIAVNNVVAETIKRYLNTP